MLITKLLYVVKMLDIVEEFLNLNFFFFSDFVSRDIASNNITEIDENVLRRLTQLEDL